MRIRLVALILAAAAGALVLLVLTLTASAANTPQDAVERFLEPRSPADACAQLADPGSGVRSCFYGMARGQPKATHLVISHVLIHEKHATLQANYDYEPGNPVETSYRLVQQHGVWLITGTFIPSR